MKHWSIYCQPELFGTGESMKDGAIRSKTNRGDSDTIHGGILTRFTGGF